MSNDELQREAAEIFAALEAHPTGAGREDAARELLQLCQRLTNYSTGGYMLPPYKKQDNPDVAAIACENLLEQLEKGLHVERPLHYLSTTLRNTEISYHRSKANRPMRSFTDLPPANGHKGAEGDWADIIVDYRMSDAAYRDITPESVMGVSEEEKKIIQSAIGSLQARPHSVPHLGALLTRYYFTGQDSYIKGFQQEHPDVSISNIKRQRYYGTQELHKLLIQQGHEDLIPKLQAIEKMHTSAKGPHPHAHGNGR